MEEFIDERQVKTDANKCPKCGGEMKYDIETTDLKCERCGHTLDFDESGAVTRRAMTDEITKNHEHWKDGAVFRCDNCGAKGVLDKKSLSKCCAFCGSPHVVSTQELAGIKPDSVIPFQITRESAREKFLKWLKSKFFAPTKLKKMDKDEQFNAIYGSSWSFSANTNTKYNGTLGRRETSTRTVNGRTQTTSTVRYFRVSGDIQQNYRDFFVQSGDQIGSKIFDKLKPFNLSHLKVYRQEYLAGIFAEHYSRTIDVCFNDFANFIKRDLRNRIMRKHNADVVQTLNLNTAYSDKAFNYVLLPVYIANYSWKAKLYNFFVNGTNGKVVGKYPKSGWKIFFTVLGAAALAAAAIVGIYLLS
jgi:DNA-directed RNA polymerase subunit RPC12/RpoP